MTFPENEIQAVYKNRINRVFQYIDENPDADLSLQAISDIACFSPFHFHRIFKAITGETTNEYVTRRRIEKAAGNLIHTQAGITEIAYKCGFSNISTFTRTFKKYYGLSPTGFRTQHPQKFSKIRQIDSKNGKAYPGYEKYICIINNLKKWIAMHANIEVKDLPRMELAYVSVIGPRQLAPAYQKLLRWATPKGLLSEQTRMITIYHDSFKITEADKVRMSACMQLHKDVAVEGEIGRTSIEAGKCIVGHFTITMDEFEKSWTGLYLWMNENGYKKADRNPFEIYYNNFNEHPERKAIVDFCIPVE